MKLCLFNVENLFILGHPNSQSYIKPLEKIEWIARTIKEIDADITMLCEVGGLENLDYFNAHYLDNLYDTALLPGNSDRGIEMGYLVKKARDFDYLHLGHKNQSINFNYTHEILEANKNQTELVSHKFSRDISELRITKDGKVESIILLVHLKSKLDKEGIDFNGRFRRAAELRTLVDFYNQRKAQFPDCPIIVAGDFNGMAQKQKCEPEFQYLYENSDLQDVLEIIEEPEAQRNTYFHFPREGKPEASQLDYIFLPNSLIKHVDKENSGVFKFRDQQGVLKSAPKDSFERYALPSDHYPVVVTIIK